MMQTIKSVLLAAVVLTATVPSLAEGTLPLRDNLTLFACQTQSGEQVSLKSVKKGSGYVLSFYSSRYVAAIPAAQAYFAYAANNEQLSFDDGRYVYQLVQFHDGDAEVVITSSKTGREIRQYECWDHLDMRLDRISPYAFQAYTDAWENYLGRRFVK